WYDSQHCHNPNVERWERESGRVYRLAYAATYKPVKVDLGALDDAQLVALHTHKNEWYVRTARRLLAERAARGAAGGGARAALADMARTAGEATQRLRALWTLAAMDSFSDDVATAALGDADEFVRGWAVQLLGGGGGGGAGVLRRVRPAVRRA